MGSTSEDRIAIWLVFDHIFLKIFGKKWWCPYHNEFPAACCLVMAGDALSPNGNDNTAMGGRMSTASNVV